MSDPFDLSDTPAYRSWREDKLGRSPTRIDALTVPLKTLGAPTKGELDAICEAVARGNLALIRCADPSGIEPGAMLGLGRHLGLTRLDANLCADEEAVSRIAVRPGGQTGEYIPYTDRPLSWHTDGYYNPQGSEVRAWMLFCVRDATSGGENALLDPELVYIRLRDQDPAMIAALMEPDAMTVPANVAEGRELRAASTGPVFSVIDGHLNMRYSARTRNIQWRDGQTLDAARECLTGLLSRPDVYIFRHKLRPGEGYVSNNVLHNRTGFTAAAGADRLLLRLRYLDRVRVRPSSEQTGTCHAHPGLDHPDTTVQDEER